MIPQRTVSVGALGGTISMTTDSNGTGALPSQGAASQVGALNAQYGISVAATDIALIGSPSMTLTTLLRALAFARLEVDKGACGVVLTHGSDTLSEAAFFLSLLWDREEPLILTGAMRPADAPGADGPGNLAGAIRCAAEPSMRGMGVLVFFADFVHSAMLCEKTDSTWVNAFSSPGWGLSPASMPKASRMFSPQRIASSHCLNRIPMSSSTFPSSLPPWMMTVRPSQAWGVAAQAGMRR